MAVPQDAAANYVHRPELSRRLDEALLRSVTLVSAPAGSGKSVLLAQWVAAHPEFEVVWLNLERADDDPVRFIRRLLGGLAVVDPEFGQLASLAYMHGGGLGPLLIEAVVTKMAERSELVIVLDDLHRLSNPVLLADIGRLIDEAPSNVHVVLASRVDPPFALSRHRLHRNLAEIRQSELAFDELDSTHLLERLTGRDLSRDQVRALVSRTEGWVAGLQLAGITLKTHPDPDDFITQFSGNDRLVADFLSDEVLQALPEDRRAVLFKIAALDQLCAELIHHLTGEPRAQTILEELERDSMFLVPLDSRRQWFRFHHLFRDLLRYRYRASDPQGEVTLLVDAASWHAARDDVGPAVAYLLRARQWERALGLIMSLGPKAFERGEMATIMGWLDAIPASARSHRVDVTLLRGIFEGITGNAASADDILRPVSSQQDATPGERACALAFLATLAQWRPDPQTSLRWAQSACSALASLGDEPVPDLLGLTDRASLEAMALAAAGRACFFLGDIAEARRWLERCRASEGATYSLWKIHLLGTLGLVEAWCGRTELAVALAEEALSVARAVGMLDNPAPSDAFLALGLAALERGEPEHARPRFEEGLLRAEANRRSQLLWIGQVISAAGQRAEGRSEGVAATLAPTDRRLGSPPPPVVADRFAGLRARALRLAGSPEQALRTMSTEPADAPALAFERVAAWLALGRADQAAKALDTWPVPADAREPLAAVERLTMLAWLSSLQGRSADAERRLDEALARAEPHSLLDVFVRAGPSVIDLLDRRPDASSGFCERVLDWARRARSPSAPSPLPDPLTDRELEVLGYLPTRLTNADLAARCFVSLNTMKTHLAHVYRKLGVNNRDEAIERARELGLLAPPGGDAEPRARPPGPSARVAG